MQELTYDEAGKVLGVHPLHVRRIVKRYPQIIQPIVLGYNKIRFRSDQVEKVKRRRQRDAVKSLNHVRKLMAAR